jgi:hypothetical protein
MQKIEEVKNPVLGKYYLVPCVKHMIRREVENPFFEWLPIIGPWHEDSDIGTPAYHFHYDARFIPKRTYESSRRSYLGKVHTAMTSHDKNTSEGLDMSKAAEVVYRRMKMLREMPEFPGPWVAQFIPKLEKTFSKHRLTCAICPHRGMPLDSLPQDELGRVVCNGHGLRWNLRTHQLSPRTL